MPRRRTPKGFRYFRREFLNREGYYLGAYILATLREDDNYGRLNISDCDRRVCLELDGEDRASLRNSVHKLDLLIATCTAMRDGLIDGFEEARQREAALRRMRDRS
jgi:hypothetical protein